MNGSLAYSLSEQLDLLAGGLGKMLPELLLSGFFLLMIILEISVGKRNKSVVPYTGLLALVLTGLAVILLWGQEPMVKVGELQSDLFLGMVRSDAFAGIFKLLFLAAGVCTFLISMASNKLKNESKGLGEYYIILLAMVLGMHFMSMSLNLLMMYLALELVSLSSYILTAYTKVNRKSAEASMKYLVYGVLSSGVMLYGISWLYGFTGTLDMQDPAFAEGIAAAGEMPVFFISLLVLTGFIFKIGAIPFHFWAPDVYEGAPYPIAAFFSVAPKAAGFAMLLRFVDLFPQDALPGLQEKWVMAIAIMAMLSMTIGNLAALRQENMRRMLAYSSIAQAGYILLGVLCFSTLGFSAVVFYLVIYFFMNFSAFLIAGWLEEKTGSGMIDDYRGLATGLPVLAVILTLVMVSLTGLPPTAGFIGKLNLFAAVVEAGNGNPLFTILLVVSVVNTVISLFYYLRVPIAMIFKNPVIKFSPRFHGLAPVMMVILAIPVLLLGIIAFDGLLSFISDSLSDFSIYIP